MKKFLITEMQYKRVKVKNYYVIEAENEEKANEIYNNDCIWDYLKDNEVIDEEIDESEVISIKEVI